MIYVTFDSCIWLNLLKESWEENNSIDAIEFWIEHEDISILLPEIILIEWENNRASKVKTLSSDWKNFYNRVKNVFGTEILTEQNTPENIKELVNNQLSRVESIFKNNSIKIPITDEIRVKATHIAFAKEKPFGTKNSMGDALIYLAMSEYIEKHELQNCVFVTDNYTDYSLSDKEKQNVHTDLKTFKSLNIEYFCGLNSFMRQYTGHLSDFTEHKKIKALKDENLKLASTVLNPQSIDNLTGLRDSYIENINILELILNNKTPTKEQVLFILGLIDSNNNYRQYFFKRVEHGLWFNILKQRGYFNPENIPSQIQVKDGIQTPFWEPLFYLEKLSNQIKDGKELELIDEIVGIIKNISENPKDNYRTWYIFANIFNNLPNNKISKSLLNYIPVWFKNSISTTALSSEICGKLLPKFLSQAPINDDIEKAEIILKHLFSIEKTNSSQNEEMVINREIYYSKVYLHFLKDIIIDKKLVTRIASFCSNDIVIFIADNLKKIFFDFPNGINITFHSIEEEFKIHVDINNKDLTISLIEKGNPDNVINSSTFLNFEDFNEEKSRDKIIEILKDFNIEFVSNRDNEFNMKIFTNSLINGSDFLFIDNSVSNLNDRYLHGEKIYDVFALIFRDLLNEKIRINPKKGVQLLRHFTFNNKYRNPFYSKVTLFVIRENWEVSKSIFWELVKDDGKYQIFSNISFQKDLYELLNKNQLLLTNKELTSLQNIIHKGPQDREIEKESLDINYWTQRWNSALRNVEPFKTCYNEQLKSSEKLTNEYYEHLGEVEFKSGRNSPFSVEEILQNSNEGVAMFILNFKPKDRWEEPSIEGLSSALGEAIEREPHRFADEINLFKDVYYIYAYHIINGFKVAWKNKRTFNWFSLLSFCKNYIESDKFHKGQLGLENDGWGATSDWVLGSIGNLLTEGMQTDNNAFDLDLLPLAKEIIEILIANLTNNEEEIRQSFSDYPTYTLNSTSGKTLRSLLDYSLRRARNLKSDDYSPRWEEDIKNLFEISFKNEVIDSYIQLGLYFKEYYYLDKVWFIKKVDEIYTLDDKKWLPFIGGMSFVNPLINYDLYKLFYPHYERAIKMKVELQNSSELGIIRHITAFFFWGFEDLKNEGLLKLFLEHAKSTTILELINFIWLQEDYYKSLDTSGARNFEEIIYDLWNFLTSKYENTEDENEKKILIELSNFLVFTPQLNEFYTSLVLISCKNSGSHFDTHYLIENLVNLKTKGNPLETAIYLGQILISIPCPDFLSSIENTHIIDLVTFLYENDQKEIALDFCNKLSKHGHEFLIGVHNKLKND